MILTLTPNPSIDTTLSLKEPLKPGSVQRISWQTSVAGGKGINVAKAAHLAGVHTLALYPANLRDMFCTLMQDSGIPGQSIPIRDTVRVNTTITDPYGETTKINGIGAALDTDIRSEIQRLVGAYSTQADWVVLAGSLPPEVPTDWYSTLVRTIRTANPLAKIAVDTSDAPLIALAENLDSATPDLIKPNGLELGQISGQDGEMLEAEAAKGNVQPVIAAARALVDRGVRYVVVTLGAAGAVLVTKEGAWRGSPPPITVASTVGAGDSSLAGFILGVKRRLDPAGCLQLAVAYGSAAASLPGTTIPGPEHLHIDSTQVQPVDTQGKER